MLTLILQFLGSSVVGKVLDLAAAWKNTDVQKYTVGVNADVATIEAQYAAQVELQKYAAQLVLADKGWWVTAWMKPFVFYPCAAYLIAILLDSMFHLGWHIAAVPAPYDAIVQNVILVTIGIIGLKGAARMFSK